MHYHFNSALVSESQQALIKQLLDCKNFTNHDRLLGFSKGRGTTWFLNTTTELGFDSVLRHYYRGGLFGKWIKDRYLFRSLAQTRCAQEFHLLEQLYQWGLPVPRPIAFKVTRTLFCYQADILLEKIANTQDLSQYLQHQRLEADEYHAIGKLIRQLHDRQVHHSDLNIHNILRSKSNGTFWLIDFDKCHIQTGDNWKQGNLDRLLRSFQKEKERLRIYFDEQDWQNLLKGYQLLTE